MGRREKVGGAEVRREIGARGFGSGVFINFYIVFILWRMVVKRRFYSF